MWKAVLREFAEETTLHGCRYLVPGRGGPCVRLCWLVAMAVSASCAVVFVSQAWRHYCESPIRTTVKTTNFPLSQIPFPAVTVCPTTKVRRSVGEKLLASLLNLTEVNDTMRGELRLVMALLANHEFPYNYRTWQFYNSATGIVRKLNDRLNVTWFMLQVLPPLEQMFLACIWQGDFGNCSTMFSLQRTEGGFCYSFNSLTSEESRHCGSWTRQQQDSAALAPQSCAVRHSLASGPTTGLELMLTDVPDHDKLIPEQRDYNGFRVLVQSVQQPPESARGLLVARRRGHATKLLLRAAVTDSRRHLLRLGARQRGCLFAGEAAPLLAREYSFKTCLMDCRLRHLLRHCNCTPYYFNHVPGYPTCNLSSISCIAFFDRALRFYRLDGGGSAEAGQWGGALNCSCLPDCHLFEYGVESQYEAHPSLGVDAYLDVHYSESAAVFYLRELTFDAPHLIVSFGGILSLFLGVSVLSLAELPHVALRLLVALYRGTRHQPPPRLPAPPHSPRHSTSTEAKPRVFRVHQGTASLAGGSGRLRTRRAGWWLARVPLSRGARRVEGAKIAAVGALHALSGPGAALPQWRPPDVARW